MTEIAERYRQVAATFTERARQVPTDGWERPAPCEGWVARDVVRHLVEWVPAFFRSAAQVDLPGGPSVDDDPVGAWLALDAALQERLDDPATAEQVHELPIGTQTFASAVAMIVLPDVLVHTWDLARAVGLDEALDPDEVHGLFVGMEPMDEALRTSGHYGPRVPVPDDADEQTKLLAFMGRHP